MARDAAEEEVSQQLDQYERDEVFGCRIWTGKRGSNGRPVVWNGRRPSSAYVLAWEAVNGKVAADRVLDHLCRRVLCVNVTHLEPVTRHENELRKSWSYRCRIAKCPRGHSMNDALVTPEMGRLCRTCRRDD